MSNKAANSTSTSVRKDMRIENELLSKVDSVRGDVPFATWVKRAIIMRLENEGHTVQSKTLKTKSSQQASKREALVKQAIELQNKGFSHQAITDEFNKLGMKSLSGKEWTRGSVGTLLRKQ